MAGLVAVAVALSGCSSFGSRAFGDPVTTGSVSQSAASSYSQPMPVGLGVQQVADNRFLPPANIGDGGGDPSMATGSSWNQSSPSILANDARSMSVAGTAPAILSQDLPAFDNASQGTLPPMQAQPSFSPAPSMTALSTLPSDDSALSAVSAPMPDSVVPIAVDGPGVFTHTIAHGESLYTIARRYEVTTQSLVQVNGLSSPDKIVVGQKIIIPGRADLIPVQAQAASMVPMVSAVAPMPVRRPLPQASSNALEQAAVQQPVAAPQQVAKPPVEPVMSDHDRFRWPVSGRVVADFSASKGTGINIEVPEGTAVKAAENGTVIYVGSGVEGYGNLILLRHPNGYVSAYAHLKSMDVLKGDVVNRGDTIGAAGMTGSVSRSQLHFEIRKGATPVDPVPLLAS